MGRAKKLKQLRKLASQLPPDFEHKTHMGDLVRGAVLIKTEGIQTLEDGTPIDPGKMYRKVSTKVEQVNHYRKMKGMLHKGSAPAMMAYINTVEAKHQVRLSAIAAEQAKKAEAAQQETEKQ